jgi:hypothetical protein
VPESLLADWMVVRKTKLTQTALDGLVREAEKAGLSLSDAITFCCEANWVGFNAGWYQKRMGVAPVAGKTGTSSKHAGFSGKNYREGVSDDGSFN